MREPFELPPPDGRTRAEKIGEVDVRQSGRQVVDLGIKNRNSLPDFSKAEKNLRLEARRLALDYCMQSVVNIYDISQTADDARTRLAAARTLLEFGLGKPSTIHISTDGAPIIPNLTIVLGDGHQAIDLNEISEYVTDAKFTIKE